MIAKGKPWQGAVVDEKKYFRKKALDNTDGL
jgi:hypothetical protein